MSHFDHHDYDDFRKKYLSADPETKDSVMQEIADQGTFWIQQVAGDAETEGIVLDRMVDNMRFWREKALTKNGTLDDSGELIGDQEYRLVVLLEEK